MEGFTLTLALVDAIPVLLFGGSILLVAGRFGSPCFLIGGLLSTLAGCCKVAWKLILGIWKKDVKWLNKPFVPMQAAGFLLILASLAVDFGKISWAALGAAVIRFPAALFFLIWLFVMGAMGWYRKNRFDGSARANWTAQILNCAGQGALFLGVLAALSAG